MRRMSTTPTASSKQRRHQRGHRSPAPVASPAQVLAQVRAAPPVTTVAIEEPLSPKEIGLYKVHFKFLREQRNVLKLRVNAAEDLLLNGVKEPAHRGVCQHLLAKVERSRVLTVSQTLPPAEAVKLLGGVLRFAPEMGYVLRYLECVKLAASPQQAGAALTQALKQTDYSQLSVAQMRQLVMLIVEVFAERDLPVFLFTMLHDNVFRAAIDRSLADFPEVLGRMLRPLRNVYDAIRNDAKGPRGSNCRAKPVANWQDVQAGVTLMLNVHPASLLELHERARWRLYQLGCQALRTNSETRGDTLQQLLMSLVFSSQNERASAVLDLASALLASAQYEPAKKLLELELRNHPQHAFMARWRAVLEMPRIGTVALERARSPKELPPSGRWYRAWDLRNQNDVLVRFGELAECSTYADQLALMDGLLVPGVCRVAARSVASGQRPYLAVELPGQPLNQTKQSGRSDGRMQRRWAVELCAMLAALAYQGIVLADADLRRFNSTDDGGLWLVDLWPLHSAESAEALRVHCELAKRACLQLLEPVSRTSMSGATLERLEQAQTLLDVVRAIEERDEAATAPHKPK